MNLYQKTFFYNSPSRYYLAVGAILKRKGFVELPEKSKLHYDTVVKFFHEHGLSFKKCVERICEFDYLIHKSQVKP